MYIRLFRAAGYIFFARPDGFSYALPAKAPKLSKLPCPFTMAEVTDAVGFAQNMAALRALATERIQKGHINLHARDIAILAGANGMDVDRVACDLAASDDVTVGKAKEFLISNES